MFFPFYRLVPDFKGVDYIGFGLRETMEQRLVENLHNNFKEYINDLGIVGLDYRPASPDELQDDNINRGFVVYRGIKVAVTKKEIVCYRNVEDFDLMREPNSQVYYAEGPVSSARQDGLDYLYFLEKWFSDMGIPAPLTTSSLVNIQESTGAGGAGGAGGVGLGGGSTKYTKRKRNRKSKYKTKSRSMKKSKKYKKYYW
jgi:uncharacterized membrane protein